MYQGAENYPLSIHLDSKLIVQCITKDIYGALISIVEEDGCFKVYKYIDRVVTKLAEVPFEVSGDEVILKK
jgi:hypothetical protein